MGELEICKEYRTAKDPAEQIKVLAQLNNMTPGKILEILEKNGIFVSYAPRKNKTGRPKKTPVTEKANQPDTERGIPNQTEAEREPAAAERTQDQPEQEETEAPQEREPAAVEPEAREEPTVWPWTSLTQLGAIRTINRLLLKADKEAKAGDELAAATNFRERVRGVLAMLHEITDSE